MSASFPGATQGYGSSSPLSMDVIPTLTMPGGDIYSDQGKFLYNANNPMTGMGGGQMSPDLQAYNMYFDKMYKPGMNSDQIRDQFYAMTPEQRASYATPGNQYAGMGIAPSQNQGVRTDNLGNPGLIPPELMDQQPPGPQPFPALMQNPAFNPGGPFRLPAGNPQQLQQIAQGQPALVNLLAPPPPSPGPGTSITQVPPPFPTLQQNPAFSQPDTTQPNIGSLLPNTKQPFAPPPRPIGMPDDVYGSYVADAQDTYNQMQRTGNPFVIKNNSIKPFQQWFMSQQAQGKEIQYEQPGTTQPNISNGMSDEQLMAIVKPGFRDLQQPAPQPAPQPTLPTLRQNPSFAQPQLGRPRPAPAPAQTMRTGPRARPGARIQSRLNRLGR